MLRIKNIEEFIIEAFQDGNNTTGQKKLWRAPFAGKVVHVGMGLGTAGITGNLIGDVNINGTSIFTTAANRPTLTTGLDTEVEGEETIDGTRTFSKGDILDFSIDTIHTGTAGIDFVGNIIVRQTPLSEATEYPS